MHQEAGTGVFPILTHAQHTGNAAGRAGQEPMPPNTQGVDSPPNTNGGVDWDAPEEVGGHAVEEAGVAGARRQAHVQLVQVVLALLGCGALWGGLAAGARGQRRVPLVLHANVVQDASPASCCCCLAHSAMPVKQGAASTYGSSQGRRSLPLTAPALPGRASPTWLNVQQGGLKDLRAKERLWQAAPLSCKSAFAQGGPRQRQGARSGAAGHAGQQPQPRWGALQPPQLQQHGAAQCTHISMGYGSQLPPMSREAWNLTASGTCNESRVETKGWARGERGGAVLLVGVAPGLAATQANLTHAAQGA